MLRSVPNVEAACAFIPAIEQMEQIDGQPTAYVCQNYVCQLPTNEVSKFVELLQ